MSDDQTLDDKLEALRTFIEDNKDLEEFLAQSRGFADSQVQQAKQSEQQAWRVAYAGGGLALVAILAVMGLTPLKTVTPPEVLVLDKSTGTTSVLQKLEEVVVSEEDVIMRKSINDFMLARESYTADTAELNYYTAAAFMSRELQAQWAAYWDTANPNSPLKVYRRDAKVRTEIHTISKGAKGIATVNFSKEIQRNGQAPVRTRYVATIPYKFVKAPTEEKLRRINPFGFQVTDYRVDPEVGGAPSPAPPASPAAKPPPTKPPVPLQAPQMPAARLEGLTQ